MKLKIMIILTCVVLFPLTAFSRAAGYKVCVSTNNLSYLSVIAEQGFWDSSPFKPGHCSDAYTVDPVGAIYIKFFNFDPATDHQEEVGAVNNNAWFWDSQGIVTINITNSILKSGNIEVYTVDVNDGYGYHDHKLYQAKLNFKTPA